MSMWFKLIIKNVMLAFKLKKINILIWTKYKKLKTELKTKNHMNWDLSVSWIRTIRTQTQI